jgi:hypothetical protein
LDGVSIFPKTGAQHSPGVISRSRFDYYLQETGLETSVNKQSDVRFMPQSRDGRVPSQILAGSPSNF